MQSRYKRDLKQIQSTYSPDIKYKVEPLQIQNRYTVVLLWNSKIPMTYSIYCRSRAGPFFIYDRPRVDLDIFQILSKIISTLDVQQICSGCDLDHIQIQRKLILDLELILFRSGVYIHSRSRTLGWIQGRPNHFRHIQRRSTICLLYIYSQSKLDVGVDLGWIYFISKNKYFRSKGLYSRCILDLKNIYSRSRVDPL